LIEIVQTAKFPQFGLDAMIEIVCIINLLLLILASLCAGFLSICGC